MGFKILFLLVKSAHRHCSKLLSILNQQNKQCCHGYFLYQEIFHPSGIFGKPFIHEPLQFGFLHIWIYTLESSWLFSLLLLSSVFPSVTSAVLSCRLLHYPLKKYSVRLLGHNHLNMLGLIADSNTWLNIRYCV